MHTKIPIRWHDTFEWDRVVHRERFPKALSLDLALSLGITVHFYSDGFTLYDTLQPRPLQSRWAGSCVVRSMTYKLFMTPDVSKSNILPSSRWPLSKAETYDFLKSAHAERASQVGSVNKYKYALPAISGRHITRPKSIQ